MIKPGYKTSEFWFTVVSFIFSGFYLLGIISDHGHKEDLIRDVSHGVESVILISGQLAILYKYINSRKQIKQTWWSTEKQKEVAIIEKAKPTSKRTSNKKKSNGTIKTRTRKTNKPN